MDAITEARMDANGNLILLHPACAALRSAAETCRRAANLLETVARDETQPGLADVIAALALTLAGLSDIQRDNACEFCDGTGVYEHTIVNETGLGEADVPMHCVFCAGV